MYKSIKREYTLTHVIVIVYNSETESIEKKNITLIGKYSSKERVLKECKKYVDSNNTVVSVEIVNAMKEIRQMSVEDFYKNSIKIEEEI